MLLDIGVGRFRVLWTSTLYFLSIKENWFFAMTRHHAEPGNMLLIRNFPFDSDVKQWNYTLISLHYLWAKSNSNRTRGQFECDVTWFCFCFDFVHSRARCDCCSVVCWLQQADCKRSTKNVNFVIFLDNCTHKSIMAQQSRKWGFS